MKKIVNIFVLIVICLLPTMVDAKVSYEINWRKDGETLVGEKEDKLYFLENIEYIFEIDSYHRFDEIYFNIYDKNGDFLNREKVYDYEETILNKFIKTDYHYFLMGYLDNYYNYFYDKTTRYLYSVSYYSEDIYYESLVDNNFVYKSLYFDSDLAEVKRILGKRYDIYTDLSEKGYNINHIFKFDDFYAAQSYDGDMDLIILSIFDKDLDVIMNLSFDNSDDIPYVFNLNGFIGLVSQLGKVNIYKLDGTFYDSFEIDTSFLEDSSGICGNYEITKVFVKNMDITFNYNFSGCLEKIILADDFVGGMSYPKPYSLNYRLKFDISKRENDGGSFNYDEKYDEEGRHVVELRITPDNGYSVKEIIVTDINGNRIDVNDNKFYMPMSDVKIEVKYVQGVYLPIPDTFLGKSITVIVIGLILIGLGFYTINYVREEK